MTVKGTADGGCVTRLEVKVIGLHGKAWGSCEGGREGRMRKEGEGKEEGKESKRVKVERISLTCTCMYM